MKKSLTAAIAALTFGGAIAASAAPAQAHDYDGYYDSGRRHHSNTGAAIAVGVVGLALGAALASSSRNSRSNSYYGGNSGYYGNNGYYGGSGNGYYGNGYARSGYGYSDDGDGYYARQRYAARTCESQRLVWDPYIRQQVLIRSTYAC